MYSTCFGFLFSTESENPPGEELDPTPVLKIRVDPSTIMTYMGSGLFSWSPDSDREVRLSQTVESTHTTTSPGVFFPVSMPNSSKNLSHIHTLQAKLY